MEKLATDRQLADLVAMNSPQAVLNEVKTTLTLISPAFDQDPVTRAFEKALCLYEGRYPGYQACNTEYHDFRHITDTFIAMARLIHGATVTGEAFSDRYIIVGLIAALYHDVGYIQEEQDRQGTGGKYTYTHVKRSMEFLQRHGSEHGLCDEEIAAGCTMIHCTDLAVDIAVISFPSHSVELLGKMLAVADLIAQMADRIYLEKLLFLYQEFREAKVSEFKNELDLLHKTLGFYDSITQRFEKKLAGADRFMLPHFSKRWGIHEDLYAKAVQRQRNYLKNILQTSGPDPLNHLKREDIVKDIRNRKLKSN